MRILATDSGWLIYGSPNGVSALVRLSGQLVGAADDVELIGLAALRNRLGELFKCRESVVSHRFERLLMMEDVSRLAFWAAGGTVRNCASPRTVRQSSPSSNSHVEGDAKTRVIHRTDARDAAVEDVGRPRRLLGRAQVAVDDGQLLAVEQQLLALLLAAQIALVALGAAVRAFSSTPEIRSPAVSA
jgi:hypothetical protein